MSPRRGEPIHPPSPRPVSSPTSVTQRSTDEAPPPVVELTRQPRQPTPAEQLTLQRHRLWLQNQLRLFTTPCIGTPALPSFDPESDDDSDGDDDTPSTGTDSPPPHPPHPAQSVTRKYVRDLINRFEVCRKLYHLPTLNLFFTLLESILLSGTRRALAALLHPRHLPRVLDAMRFNPTFNCHHTISPLPTHSECLPRRLEAIPLPARVASLATTVQNLQYLKDCVVPVVCDESKFLTLTLHIQHVRRRLCASLLEDQSILAMLFTRLTEESVPIQNPIERTQAVSKVISCLRFLKETIDLAIHSSTDPSSFWTSLIRGNGLLPTMSRLLAHPCAEIRRRCIDVALLLCDEEARRQLQPLLPMCPAFLTRLLQQFLIPGTEEGAYLQLQATLPMLVANPHPDSLTLFYSASHDVLRAWVDQSRGDRIPSPQALCPFLELLSLAIHHHSRTFHYHHPVCVAKLVELAGIIWSREPRAPTDVLVAVNKGVLSVLHLGSEAMCRDLEVRGIFIGVLRAFSEGNDLLTSSILTLLHTVLQLDIRPLVAHIGNLWLMPSVTSPLLITPSYVQQLFMERCGGDL